MRLALFGPVDGPTGYDEVTRSLINELYVRGHFVTLVRHTKWTADKIEHGFEEILDRCEKAQYPIDTDFSINVCLPEQALLHQAAVNVAYTMFEADKIPNLWLEAIKNLDLILVPTEWNRDAFIDSGVDANKIMVARLGVHPQVYNPGVPPLGMVTDRGRSVADFKHRFLCVQELVSRKNVPSLLRVWSRTVKKEDDACLILKLGSHSGDKLAHFKERVLNDLTPAELEIMKETVLIYTRLLPERAMPSLYSACTHYITMSCGEGWGLPECKAGAMGKYLVAPNHTGFSAYVNEDTAFVIGSLGEPAKQEGPTGRLYDGATWFRPSEGSAAEQIRASIEAHNAGDRSKPDALRELIVNEYNVSAAADELLDCLTSYSLRGTDDNNRVSYEKKDVFSNFAMYVKTLGSRCGIADYTHFLYTEMLRKHQEEDNIGTGLLTGKQDNGLLDLIDRNSVEVVHLQLEYQFIGHERLRHLLQHLKARDIKSVITMHTVHPKVGAFNQVVAEHANATIVSSKLMADTMRGLSNPEHYGNRLEVIPIGCDIEKSVKFSGSPFDGQRPYRLGFFGFSYFHKGIDRLLIALKTLHAIWGEGRVVLEIFSVKPEQDSVDFFEKCRDMVEFLGLKDWVRWNDQFLEEADVVRRLSTTDLIVLPYSEYGGVGSSAAGRTALKAGVPLMVTPNSFFYDIINTGTPLVAVSPANMDLSTALASLLHDYIQEPSKQQLRVQEFTEARDGFFMENSWRRCALAHLKLYNEIVQ